MPNNTEASRTSHPPTHPHWVLVCGGRSYSNAATIAAALGSLTPPPAAIITGGAPGADSLAAQWAHAHGIRTITIKAQWEQHGRAAGPIRNQQLVSLRPALVLAFPGGPGTACLVRLATEAGIPVWHSPQ